MQTKTRTRKKSKPAAPIAHNIGTLNEGPLHASLKQSYIQPGDRVEVKTDGYVVDILRDDLIIEVQTGNFSSIARKLRDLVERHHVRLVYPVPSAMWIVKVSKHGELESRRKSPKKAGFEEVFTELVSLPDLISHPNFEIEVLLTHEEQLRRFDKRRRWRRKGWVTVESRLLEITDRLLIQTPDDLMDLVPSGLPDPFLTSDLATALKRTRFVAQKVAYCLRHCGSIQQVGKKGNAIIYSRSGTA
jgi:hypothetical protein